MTSGLLRQSGLDAPASGLRTLGPGFNLDAPLTAPHPDNFGLPALEQPEVGVLAPVVQTAANANLGAGGRQVARPQGAREPLSAHRMALCR
ncbi:hypothetical protein [Streptomyces sp. NPDC048191]|uniref:hypothetical protein n=1 Tax=Streptomyces sp. NPDC048191 TaxID=3155484 RepID=UPI0033C94337